MRTRQLGLGSGTDADGARAQGLRPLPGNEANTPCGRKEDDSLAGLHPVGLPQQIPGRKTLQHRRSGRFGIHPIRHLRHAPGGHDTVFRIRP